MALTAGPHQAVLFTLVAAVLGLAAASHFRGAIVEWRPVDPVNFDGRVSMCSMKLSTLFESLTLQ